MDSRVQVSDVYAVEGNVVEVEVGHPDDPPAVAYYIAVVVEAVAGDVGYCHPGFHVLDKDRDAAKALAGRFADRVREAGSIDLDHWVDVTPVPLADRWEAEAAREAAQGGW